MTTDRSPDAHAGGGAVTLARLAAMMFLQFFVWGSWYVSTGVFIKNGSGWESADWVNGWAYSVAPIAAILAPLFLGIVADRYFASERVLAVLMLLGTAALAAIPPLIGGTDDTTLYLFLLLGHSLCFMPTLGLTNTIAFTHLTAPEKQFPIVRVFGTLGWIVATNLVGFWEDLFLDQPDGPAAAEKFDLEADIAQYWVAAGASLAFGLYALTLPHTPPPAKGQKSRVSDLLGLGALGMLKDRSFAVFMFASALLCVPLAGYYGFAGAFVGDSGYENPTAAMSFGQISEVFFMLAMPLAFVRLGVKWMLAVGMAAWVARYGLFSAAAAIYGGEVAPLWERALTPAGGMIFLGVLLHGICYDFFFVTGQIYTEKKAPPALRGQAQGFLVLMTQGVGLLIGAQLFAALADANKAEAGGDLAAFYSNDWTEVWLWPCVAAGVILAAFCLLFRDRLSPTQRAELAGDDVAAEPAGGSAA